MLCIVSLGIGVPGKLWTGMWPERNGAIVDALIIERRCPCGATTRKFRAYPVEYTEEAKQAMTLPSVYVTAGGVGSTCLPVELCEAGLATWNWSGRVGGHAIVSPVCVRSGYVEWRDLPQPNAGWKWWQTYGGSTLSEYVLLGSLDRHALPLISLSGECPPCRRVREEEEAAAVLPAGIAELRRRAIAAGCSDVARRIGEVTHDVDGLRELARENVEWLRSVAVSHADLELPADWREFLPVPSA